MSKYIDTKYLVSDFLNDRLSSRERISFLKLYASIVREDREDADLIFDEIQVQVDALSDEELELFLKKIEAFKLDPEKNKTILLSKAKTYLKHAALVIILLSFSIWFYNNFQGPQHSLNYLTKQDRLIWLPDSSSVFLKAGSSLHIESSYNHETREVILEGEGFFEIKPNKQKAFIVTSKSGFFTKVLGTSFLMSTKRDSNKVEVKTGKVQVGNRKEVFAVLLAGDTLLKDEQGNVVINRNEQYIKSSLIQFENENLQSVTKILMQEFAQEIVLDKSVPTGLKYTATFSSEQTLDEILIVLCDLHQLKYKTMYNTIIIYK